MCYCLAQGLLADEEHIPPHQALNPLPVAPLSLGSGAHKATVCPADSMAVSREDRGLDVHPLDHPWDKK